MHNEESSDLFNLIHIMNKGEKRYFKLFMRARSPHMQDMKYLRLFDAIEKQKQYNEEKIAQLSIVKQEHLRVLKHYLYHLILESMRALRNKTDDIDSKLRGLLENALIMRDKGLEKEELKWLVKAKLIAIKHERWGTAIDALFRERKIIGRKEDAEPWRKLDNEIDMLFSKLINLKEHQYLNREVKILTNQSALYRNVQLKALKKLRVNPLLNDTKKCFSLEAQRISLFTLFNHYTFLEDHQRSYKILKQLVHLIESNLLIFENPDMTYAQVLNNIILSQFHLGKYEEALQHIQKYRTLAKKSGPAQAQALVYASINETHYYLQTGEFKKGATAAKEIEKELNVIKPAFPLVLTFLYYNIASIYFGACEYRKALIWINKIINHPKTIFREDVQAFARIMQILIQYELNSPGTAEHLIISTYRFLLKRKQLLKTEESILRFIRRLSKMNASRKILLKEFGAFRNELVQITRDPEEKKALEYFDLISWLESKIENRPFAEIAKEKFLKEEGKSVS